MYCPNCKYPIAGQPETCPNCGYKFPQEDIGRAAEMKTSESAGTPFFQGPVVTEKKLDKKTLWSAICFFVPVVILLLAVAITKVFIQPTASPTPMVVFLGIVILLLGLVCIVSVPLSLFLAIFGLRSIKRSAGALKGRALGIWIIVLSSLFIIGSLVEIGLMVKRTADYIKNPESAYEKLDANQAAQVIQIYIPIIERLNREKSVANSFGTYYPAILDSAAVNSESSDTNPFFTEVLTGTKGVKGGWKAKGWKKGNDMNTYIFLKDSTVFIYDPKIGKLERK